MKTRFIYPLFLLIILSLLLGCGGDGGSGTGTTAGYGTISLDITDAKPFLEGDQPDELRVVIDEVLIHQSGGGWISLDLPQYPFEINLLGFYDGLTTQLVPPALIPEGKITQIRMVISRAYMVFYGNPDDIVEIDVPSGKLRTDKQCDWWMYGGDALRITIHFDLSRSIVQTGADKFKIQPVVHLFNTDLDRAATIRGSIAADSFTGDPPSVVATVIFNGQNGDETYTKVWIEKVSEVASTDFRIYWIVPLTDNTESYTVEITNGIDTYREPIGYPNLQPGDEFPLSGGAEIEIPTD